MMRDTLVCERRLSAGSAQEKSSATSRNTFRRVAQHGLWPLLVLALWWSVSGAV